MVKRKSMKQLFAAAYFLILLLPGKCFSHQIAKGRAYVSNPFISENPQSICLGEVEIQYSWEPDQVLTFFQVAMTDPEFGVSFIFIPNSPALLQALNQAIHFGAAGADVLDEPLPDFQMPLLFDQFPRFQVLFKHRMGKVTSIRYRTVTETFSLRSYQAGSNKLLGVLSAKATVGPLGNLVAISFGGALYIRIASEFMDSLDTEFDEKPKRSDSHWRPDSGGGAGGAGGVMVNFVRERLYDCSGDLFVSVKYWCLLELLMLKSRQPLDLF